MATDPNTGGFRPVTHPNQFPPMPAIARILSRFDRRQLEGFISVAIDLADAMDGEPDEETCASEDDFTPITAEIDFGPGCIIADPGEPEDDMGAEERGEQGTWSNAIDQRSLSAGCMAWHGNDDLEDDDPREDAEGSGI